MNWITLACAFLITQTLFSFWQIHYYQNHLQKLIRRYQGQTGYHLYSTMQRNRLGLRAIGVLIINPQQCIEQCHILQGLSIFSRFKVQPQYQQLTLQQLRQTLSAQQQNRNLSLNEKVLLKTANSVCLSLNSNLNA